MTDDSPAILRALRALESEGLAWCLLRGAAELPAPSGDAGDSVSGVRSRRPRSPRKPRQPRPTAASVGSGESDLGGDAA